MVGVVGTIASSGHVLKLAVFANSLAIEVRCKGVPPVTPNRGTVPLVLVMRSIGSTEIVTDEGGRLSVPEEASVGVAASVADACVGGTVESLLHARRATAMVTVTNRSVI